MPFIASARLTPFGWLTGARQTRHSGGGSSPAPVSVAIKPLNCHLPHLLLLLFSLFGRELAIAGKAKALKAPGLFEPFGRLPLDGANNVK